MAGPFSRAPSSSNLDSWRERERGGRGGSGGSYIVQHTDGVQEEHDVSEHLLCPFLEMFSLCP